MLLFALERRAARRDRARERVIDATQSVLRTLTFFVTVDPTAERWDGELRTLRAEVLIFQAMLPKKERYVGAWLMLEVMYGQTLMREAMDNLGKHQGSHTIESVLAIMDSPHTWAAQTTGGLANWLAHDHEVAGMKARALMLSERYRDVDGTDPQKGR